MTEESSDSGSLNTSEKRVTPAGKWTEGLAGGDGAQTTRRRSCSLTLTAETHRRAHWLRQVSGDPQRRVAAGAAVPPWPCARGPLQPCIPVSPAPCLGARPRGAESGAGICPQRCWLPLCNHKPSMAAACLAVSTGRMRPGVAIWGDRGRGEGYCPGGWPGSDESAGAHSISTDFKDLIQKY